MRYLSCDLQEEMLNIKGAPGYSYTFESYLAAVLEHRETRGLPNSKLMTSSSLKDMGCGPAAPFHLQTCPLQLIRRTARETN